MARGDDQPGRVLILNGGSSAGKTTLGRTLQSALADSWLLLGVDLLIWMLPPELVDHPDGLSVSEGVITRGERFSRLYDGFRSAVAAMAHRGVSVILDDVTLDGAADQRRWNEALQGLEVCWIGVRCAPDVVAAREARRASRLPGIARHQASSVHEGVRYEVEVDTGILDVRDEVSVIAELLGRIWSLPVSMDFDERPSLPVASAWKPGGSGDPAPWER